MSTELLREIETTTNHYAAKRDELRAIASRCKAEMDVIRERYRTEIRAAASDAAAAHDELKRLIDEHRSLFAKPRTRLFSGIKVGLRKAPGRVKFADVARTIALIKAKLPDLVNVLLRSKEEPVLEAVKALEPKQLAAIGASLVATGDEIVIDHASDDVDALIDALTAEVA